MLIEQNHAALYGNFGSIILVGYFTVVLLTAFTFIITVTKEEGASSKQQELAFNESLPIREIAQRDIKLIIDNSIEFDDTLNIPYYDSGLNKIPEDKRRAWIGLFYREINIIPEHSERKIKAVGWKIDSIFAYYNLDKDDYTGSYH